MGMDAEGIAGGGQGTPTGGQRAVQHGGPGLGQVDLDPGAPAPAAQPRSLRRLRRWRLVWTVLAAITLAAMVLTRGREVGVAAAGVYLSVTDGTLSGGTFEPNPNATRDDGDRIGPLYLRKSWNHEWTMAWRPFRVKVDYGLYWIQEGVVIPLWPVLVVSLLGAGWTHGVLAGMRRARTTHCAACGYDLRAVPIREGRRVCPECGLGATSHYR